MARPTLVLLHALGASGSSWREVERYVSDRFDCVAPDLPGFGDRSKDAASGIDATLDLLTALIGERASERYLLVGHSMGGKFATLLAARAETGEARLAGLAGVILLAASPPEPEPMTEERRAEMVGWFADGTPSQADARRFVADNVAGSLGATLEARAIADVRRANPAAWIDWLERGAREDRSGQVGRLAVPALIVAGGEDGDLGEANQRRLNLPHYINARIVTLAGAAHLLPYERPVNVAKLIDDLWRSVA